VRVDFRYLVREDRDQATWVKRSDETALRDRLLWLVGDVDQVDELARELGRSRSMVNRYKSRQESLSASRKLLLQQESNRVEDLEKQTREAVDAAFMAGRMYFRGLPLTPGAGRVVCRWPSTRPARACCPTSFRTSSPRRCSRPS
jgi:hypothetical protein